MRKTVCVGVTVHAEPAQLQATLRFLQSATPQPDQIVLLPDGPDAETARELATDPALRALPQWSSDQPAGGAAAFNRLIAGSRAEVVVLLASGTLVGPRWLEFLLAALARPGCGLAGPSTNRADNEQQIAPSARAEPAAVGRDAGQAIRRFGHAARTLEPGHTLADFCYAVRREVIERVGAADEGYQLAPGWQLDYNLQAARAGFRGVWVGAAYAYRLPATERDRQADRELTEVGAARYRARLLEPPDVEPLMPPTNSPAEQAGQRGAASRSPDLLPGAHAARSEPPPKPPGRPPHLPRHAADRQPAGWTAADRALSGRAWSGRLSVSDSATPLVSCIMPTRHRPEFAAQAVRYFQRQDYPRIELVIVDDGDQPLADLLPADRRIRVVPSALSHSIGALRNLACEHAQGDIVMQWDDDDWHGPHRISAQVQPLRTGEADITALRDALVFELDQWRFWRMSEGLHRTMFVRDVHGGTLAFRRSVWQRTARYPDRSLAEDAAFLDQAVRRGARLQAIGADGLFVYLRHASNSWQLVADAGAGWQRAAEPALPAADRAFYASRSANPPADRAADAAPLISAIMPTYDRREFVPRAIRYFLRQDYPAKQLVILDDGSDCVADLVPADDRIVYRRLDQRMVLGSKRNLACELADGSLVAHWDDDDWQSPHRLSNQVAAMLESGSDLCGSRALSFYDPAAARAWRFSWPAGARIWAAGSSLCYSRDLWRRSPFPEVATGEDSRFVWSKAVRSMHDISESDSLIGIIHSRNTVRKTVHGAHWAPVPTEQVERVLGADLAMYRASR